MICLSDRAAVKVKKNLFSSTFGSEKLPKTAQTHQMFKGKISVKQNKDVSVTK